MALDTPILTNKGFKPMRDIQVGDTIFDKDGITTKVMFVSNINNIDCYKIVFSDNSILIADGEHQWLTYTKLNRKSINRGFGQIPTVKNTRKILNTLKHGKENNHTISLCKPVVLENKSLIIDPYVLGVWLGDGSSRCGEITTTDKFILDELSNAGYTTKLRERITYAVYTKEKHISSKHKGKYKTLACDLKKLNLIKNKHIPEDYLYNSIDNRLALLQGLMDTDGTADKSNNICEFYSTNERLSNGVYFLIVSLGLRATISEKKAICNGKDCGICYRIKFTSRYINVFRLPRKLKILQNNKSKKFFTKYRSIKSITKIDSVPTKCIQVDSPSNTYLAGESLIPTHNTVLAMLEAFHMISSRWNETHRKQRIWVVAPTFPLVREDWLSAEELLKDVITNKKQTEMKLELDPFGFIEFKSAEREDEGLRGAGLDGAIVDEASRVSQKSWEQGLRPSLADKRGRCVFISTPKGRNWFYNLWLRGQGDDPEIKSWRYATNQNPFFPEDEWLKIKATTPELTLRQEYLADFLEDEGSVFHNIEGCLRGELETSIDGERYTIGIDLARSEDFTVITIVRNSTCQLVNIHRSKDRDWSLQKRFIKSICRVYEPNVIHIDATGLGNPIEEDLRKDGLNIRPYKFTQQSKAVLVEQLQVAIEQGLIGIPNCEQTRFLIDELKSFSYERTPLGNIRYEAPSGLHDDGVISLGLAVKGASHIFYRRALEGKGSMPENCPARLLEEAETERLSRIKALPRRLQRFINTGGLVWQGR